MSNQRQLCRACNTNSYEPGYGCHACDLDVHNIEASNPPAAPPNLAMLKFDPSKIAAASDFIERNMPDILRYQAVFARLQHERYSLLLAVGFTSEQAIELLKTPMF